MAGEAQELMVQLSQLGSATKTLQGRRDDPRLGRCTIDDLRDSQMRLADEQVRYQLALRNDVAHLAEQLRPRS